MLLYSYYCTLNQFELSSFIQWLPELEHILRRKYEICLRHIRNSSIILSLKQGRPTSWCQCWRLILKFISEPFLIAPVVVFGSYSLGQEHYQIKWMRDAESWKHFSSELPRPSWWLVSSSSSSPNCVVGIMKQASVCLPLTRPGFNAIYFRVLPCSYLFHPLCLRVNLGFGHFLQNGLGLVMTTACLI